MNCLVSRIFTGVSAVGLVALFTGTAFGQATPAAPLAFEVASVKRNVSGGNGGGTRQLAGSFTATNSTLQAFIRYAWNVMDYQIQGPGWMATERYDINAKVVGTHDNHDVRLVLRTLLAERFALKTRTEIRQLPVYTLVVAKSGSKLHESKPAESSAMSSSDGTVNANKITLQILATLLSGHLDRPVVDSTGLTGTYDVNLEWTPDASESDSVPLSGPSLGTALQEQLGLRMESGTGPVNVVLIDYAERVPTEN
jgi:uncharacterized protein (TIGR03435 family)